MPEDKIETCPFCKKRGLFSQDEKDLRICNRCADRQYENYQEQAEWNYYHRD